MLQFIDMCIELAFAIPDRIRHSLHTSHCRMSALQVVFHRLSYYQSSRLLLTFDKDRLEMTLILTLVRHGEVSHAWNPVPLNAKDR
jgi:hypothetical protein